MPPKKILLMHVYVVNYWFLICKKLLNTIPHDDVYVHVSYDTVFKPNYWLAFLYFKFHPKIKTVYFSKNTICTEVKAFELFRKEIDMSRYSILTYIHAKGVTKPHNSYIKDWVELMRYFIMDRMDICEKAFDHGYKLYGTNLNVYQNGDSKYGPFQFSNFHFSGNFVSVNLVTLRQKILTIKIDDDYFGLEGFWGKLCDVNEVYCPFCAPVDLYKKSFPESMYKNSVIDFEK